MKSKQRLTDANDSPELEADRLADNVMRMSLAKVNFSSKRPNVPGTPALSIGNAEDFREKPARELRKGARNGPAEIGAAFGSPGGRLDSATRGFFEPRFGHDFSGVRIHADERASVSADSLGALAYTDGRDLVFGRGQYSPNSADGSRLLAHELAHVVQYRAGIISAPGATLYRKAKAIRFQDEPTLDDISDGKKTLAQGDKGEAVIRIASALAEIGVYAAASVDETFGPPLTAGVTAYQGAKSSLKGKAPSGKVEKLTFDELDKDFSSSYKIERDVASKQKAPTLLAGTQSLDAAEKKASARAISTEVRVNPVTGLPPTFVPDIPGKGKYEDRLTTLVDAVIVSQYDRLGKGRAAAHADPAKLYDWSQIEIIGKQSQKAVDSVFSQYYTGKPTTPLKQGVNVLDAWDDKVSTLTAGGKPAEDAAANWRVEKILTGENSVATLDGEHGAIQSRPAEAAIVKRVQGKLVAKYRTELIETHKGWPGFEDNGKIFIQRFKGASSNKQRWDMWRYFQTFIHEYIHSLEDSAHIAYRQTLGGEQKGGKTLREGVTDYFTKIVWSSITIDDPLRKTIEGPFHDPADKFAVPPVNTYHEAENAERLAGVVGLRNLMAAFFLGKVDLIGKP